MKYKVSVIVPAYNATKHIYNCIDSILSQSLQDIEIIVVNDGSTDNTLEILEKLALNDNRLKIINQENQSVGAARSNGVYASNSNFIAFVDSDDTIFKDMLKIMYEKAIKNNSDIVVCDYVCVDEENNILKTKKFQNIKPHFQSMLNFKINTETWNKLYKKELFTKNNFRFKERVFCEDLASNIELFYYAKQIDFANEPLYNYYVNPNGASYSVTSKNIDDVFLALQTNKQFLIKNNIFKKYKEQFSFRILYQLDLMNSSKDLKQYINKKLKEYNYFDIESEFITKEYLLDDEKFKSLKFKAYSVYKQGIKSVFIYGYGEPFKYIENIFNKYDIKIDAVIETQDNKRKLEYKYGTLDTFKEYLDGRNILIISLSYESEIQNTINSFFNTNNLEINII